ncbi:hypothetical protein Tco_1523923, partial [Tanacetum coccineum]
ACSFMLCDLDFEPLSLSLSSLPSCDLVSFTNILILCLILKASNQSLRKLIGVAGVWGLVSEFVNDEPSEHVHGGQETTREEMDAHIVSHKAAETRDILEGVGREVDIQKRKR